MLKRPAPLGQGSGVNGAHSITGWLRSIQAWRGFVLEKDFAELSLVPSSAETVANNDGCSIARKCVGLPCMLAGGETAFDFLHSADRAVLPKLRFEACLGRCWKAPVVIVGEHVHASSLNQSRDDKLKHYLSNGGYGVYRNLLARRRTAESVADALSSSSLATAEKAKTPVGVRMRTLRELEVPPSLLVLLDASLPGDMSQAFFVENYTHAILEGLLIVAAAVRAKDVVIHCNETQQPSAAQLRCAFSEITSFAWGAVPLIRFSGPEELSVRDLRPQGESAALLVLEPEVLWRIPTTLSLGYDPLQSTTAGFASQVLYSVTGCVAAPGVYQAPIGVSVGQLIEMARGMKDGHTFDSFVAGAWDRPALGASYLDLRIADVEMQSNPHPAYPVCVLSKEAPIRRQHAFVAVQDDIKRSGH